MDVQQSWPSGRTEYWILLVAIGVIAAIGLVAGRHVNVNRFSLHALYRNRIICAFLGASNVESKPVRDRFTGFDNNDNLPFYQLWPISPVPPETDETTSSWVPFHVVNMALNLVSGEHLAWQQRKAESFTVSPLHCGASELGYRPTEVYGDPKGITVGTAVAISGAAVSPNMGYHSSPPLALLMTLFNVRLGWWLGNPGVAGESTYKREGPATAQRALLNELFGATTDTREYVYLSDGGHFENLGLYEMVRRRCRRIVVSDAGCDPTLASRTSATPSEKSASILVWRLLLQASMSC